MKIPYYIIANVPPFADDSDLAAWVRSNDTLIGLVVANIKGRVINRDPRMAGRPRKDEALFIQPITEYLTRAGGDALRSEVVRMMMDDFPVSSTAARDILKRLAASGVVTLERVGDFQWSPISVKLCQQTS